MRTDPTSAWWIDRAGRTESRIIQCGQVFPDCPRCLLGIDLVWLPISLGRRVLPVRVSLNDAGVCRKALAACQSLRDAAGNHRFEQMAQQIVVTETAVPVLGKGRVIRHGIGQVETAEPAVSEIEVDLLAKSTFRTDTHDVADQQHPDRQFRINRRSPSGAVERCQVLPDATQIHKPIHRPEHVVRRDMRLNRELVEQSALRFLPGSHHRRSPPPVSSELNQRSGLQASRVFQQNRLEPVIRVVAPKPARSRFASRTAARPVSSQSALVAS